MAITVTQSKGDGFLTNVSSLPVTFDSTPAAGATIVVAVFGFTPNKTGSFANGDCTDNKGNSYVVDNQAYRSTNNQHVAIFHGTATTVSATFTVSVAVGSAAYGGIMVLEIPAANNLAIDTASATATANGNPLVTGTTGATTQADEISIVVGGCSGGGNETGVNALTGYTTVASHADGSTGEIGTTAYKILTGTGTQSGSWSLSVVEDYAGAIQCYKSSTISAAVTGTATASITEADIVTGGKTIIITLTGDTWVPV